MRRVWVPALTGVSTVRAVVAAVAAALLVLLLPLAGQGTASPPHEPVVFVHGVEADGSDFDALQSAFAAAGWSEDELVAFSYDWRRDTRATAELLAAEVERVQAATGAERVDLVTHSMGALPSRWYLTRLGGTAHVDAWVSLAGVNAGSVGGFRCDDPSCHDRRWGSPLLRALSAGDRTPGPVRYATWWSPCDQVLDPDTTVLLPGARNTRTGCLSHGELLRDPAVAREVIAFVGP